MDNLPIRYTEAIAHRPEADSFQLGGAVATIKRAAFGHKWIVLATVILTTALVGLYIWIWPPTFQAEVMIAVDSDKDVQRAAFYQGWNVFRKEGLTDEATLMVGPPVLRATVDRLDLKYEDVYHPFTQYVVYLWGKSWVGRNYREFKNWILGKDPNPYKLTEEQLDRYRVISDFSSGVATRQLGEASIGLLIVKGSNQKVAEIANTIVDIYLKQRRERYIGEAQQAHQSLQEEADKVQQELNLLDQEVRQFRSETGAVLVFEKDRSQIGQALVLRSIVTDLRAAIADNEASLKTLETQLAGEGAKLTVDRMYRDDAFKDRLGKLEAALAGARQTFQPGAPDIKELEDQIVVARSSLGNLPQDAVVRNSALVGQSYELLRSKKLAIESALSGARSALEVKQAELGRMQSLIDQIPAKMQVNHDFERRQSFLESKLNGLSDKLAMAAVSMATAKSAPPAMRVVEPASVPEQAVWPQTKLLLLSAVAAGLLVGVIVALMLELIFVRASHARLAGGESGLRLFAVVERDDEFLERLYPRGAAGR